MSSVLFMATLIAAGTADPAAMALDDDNGKVNVALIMEQNQCVINYRTILGRDSPIFQKYS
jgi:hypothetical protein